MDAWQLTVLVARAAVVRKQPDKLAEVRPVRTQARLHLGDARVGAGDPVLAQQQTGAAVAVVSATAAAAGWTSAAGVVAATATESGTASARRAGCASAAAAGATWIGWVSVSGEASATWSDPWQLKCVKEDTGRPGVVKSSQFVKITAKLASGM